MKEENIKNKEAVLGALSAFLRGDNLESKREFILAYNGLDFLIMILLSQ